MTLFRLAILLCAVMLGVVSFAQPEASFPTSPRSGDAVSVTYQKWHMGLDRWSPSIADASVTLAPEFGVIDPGETAEAWALRVVGRFGMDRLLPMEAIWRWSWREDDFYAYVLQYVDHRGVVDAEFNYARGGRSVMTFNDSPAAQIDAKGRVMLAEFGGDHDLDLLYWPRGDLRDFVATGAAEAVAGMSVWNAEAFEHGIAMQGVTAKVVIDADGRPVHASWQRGDLTVRAVWWLHWTTAAGNDVPTRVLMLEGRTERGPSLQLWAADSIVTDETVVRDRIEGVRVPAGYAMVDYLANSGVHGPFDKAMSLSDLIVYLKSIGRLDDD